MPLVSAVCLQSVAASPCAFVGRKEKTRYSRAHSDWELVVVAQELLYRLADMSLIRWLACLIRWSAIKPQEQTSSFTYQLACRAACKGVQHRKSGLQGAYKDSWRPIRRLSLVSLTRFQGRLQGCLAAHPLSCLTANTVSATKKRASRAACKDAQRPIECLPPANSAGPLAETPSGPFYTDNESTYILPIYSIGPIECLPPANSWSIRWEALAFTLPAWALTCPVTSCTPLNHPSTQRKMPQAKAMPGRGRDV